MRGRRGREERKGVKGGGEIEDEGGRGWVGGRRRKRIKGEGGREEMGCEKFENI